MGWSDCGTDSMGRPIGYAHVATCDHPGCDTVIDRGLSYACGGMHGDDVFSCEKYFCAQHLRHSVQMTGPPRRSFTDVCDECAEHLRHPDSGWAYDEEGGYFYEAGSTSVQKPEV
jgi:hypothetical protein